MNFEKYTKNSIKVINQANNIAIDNQNSYIGEEHIFYAMLDNTIIFEILQKMGINTFDLNNKIREKLNLMPKVSGQSEVYPSSNLVKILEISALSISWGT